jgi:predicted methyltransferase
MKNVIHIVRSRRSIDGGFETLDLITFFFAYHDMAYMQVDRGDMNRKLFAALKPGGYLVVADHSAKTGDGTTVENLPSHRGTRHAVRKAKKPVSSLSPQRIFCATPNTP